jgi:8-oxo-dGTP diphosphatase
MTIQFCPHCGHPVTAQVRFGKPRQVCANCGYVHFDDPKVAAVVFVDRVEGEHREVLLVRRGVDPGKGLWALPAGFVDRGEDPREAAIREASEETGLQVEIGGLLDVLYNQNGHIVIVYAARWVSGVLRAGDDAEEARWFSPENLPELAFESTNQLVSAWVQRGKP